MAELFRPHLLGLAVAYTLNGKIYDEFFSGFLFGHNQRLYWITAGNVLENLTRLQESEEVEIQRAGLVDLTTLDKAERIPIDLGDACMLPIWESGVDLGVVCLTPHEGELLAAPGTNWVVTSDVWRGLDLDAAEGFYLMGSPRQLNELGAERPRADGTAFIQNRVTWMALPVKRIPRNPLLGGVAEFWQLESAFYGRLVEFERYAPRLDDLDGMSGAPLFSIQRQPDGQIRYHLAGIQSAWLSRLQILRATPVQVLELVMNKIDKEIAEIESTT